MNKPHPRPSFLIRDSIANILRMGSLIAIAVGLFAMASGGVMIYLNLTGQLELERADRAATQQAGRIASELSDIQTSLRDASVVDAARSMSTNGSGVNRELRQALAERGVVNILDATLLPASVDEIALSEDSGLGFATTELVIEAIRNERAEIRVLEPGTPAESLAFAQRMPGDSGVLLLRVTVSVVTRLLEGDEMLDFVALAQFGERRQTVLGATGRATAARIHRIPIAGSSLVLQWSRSVPHAPLDNRAAVILGSSGVIVLMIGLMLRRRTRLARYLAPQAPPQPPPEEPVAGPRTGSRGRPPRAAGQPGRRASKTVVLSDDEKTGRAGAQQSPSDDEPPTVVAASPDLPEWLREDFDSELDEIAPDDDSQRATQPMPEVPLPDEEEDDLMEDFDTYQGVDPSLFKPDGIFGKAGQDIGVPDMVILGQAIGSEAVDQGLRRICVAHDGRESGPDLTAGLIQGLSVSGIDVVELGAVPAPVAWFAGMRLEDAGAVVVTGGDRAEDVNGLEIVFDGMWLGREERRSLLDRIRNQEFATGAGEHSESDERRNYCEQLAASQRLQRPLRVVLDCGNAVNGALAPDLFESLGVDVIPLNADAETRADQVADFDSDQRRQDLELCVDNFAADLGVSFDRTGNRLRVVAPQGRVLDAAPLATRLAKDLAEQGREGPLLADEALAGALEDDAEAVVTPFGGDVREMQRAMREADVPLAVKADGTVCVGGDWHGLPDAFYAAAWLLSVLAADERPPSEVLWPGQA